MEPEIQNDQVDDPQTEIEQLSDHLREYVGIRRELFELRLWDKLFGTSAAVITWSIIGFLGIISVVLLSVGIAFWIGSAIGKTWIGFVILAGGYALAAFILFLGRKRLLQKPLEDRFIENLVNEDDHGKRENAEHAHQQQDAA